MSKKSIVKIGNKTLREKAERVYLDKITSPEIQQTIQTMSDTLAATSDGIGIAAPQIGVPLQIFIASEEALFERKKDETKNIKHHWKHFVFINPRVVKLSRKKKEDYEGCLSVPGKYGLVKRAEKITIRAYDEHGMEHTRGASGLFARLFQHEIDHLQGILFIDKAQKIITLLDHKKENPV